MKLKDIQTSEPLFGEAKITKIPNQFGEWRPCINVTVFGKTYNLGGISADADVVDFSKGNAVCVYESHRGTAFVIFRRGMIYVRDVEDEKIAVVEDNLLFYSDAGISSFSNTGEFQCLFNDFNQYFIDIDTSAVREGFVGFTMGNGSIRKLSVQDIVSQIGVAKEPDYK